MTIKSITKFYSSLLVNSTNIVQTSNIINKKEFGYHLYTPENPYQSRPQKVYFVPEKYLNYDEIYPQNSKYLNYHQTASYFEPKSVSYQKVQYSREPTEEYIKVQPHVASTRTNRIKSLLIKSNLISKDNQTTSSSTRLKGSLIIIFLN